jgi:hypothetical protein
LHSAGSGRRNRFRRREQRTVFCCQIAGIDRVIPPILAPDEERGLKASAAIVRQHIGGIAH